MTSVLEQLPKPGWYNAGMPPDAIAEELRRVNRVLQSVPDPDFGLFAWTHDVFIESTETDPPGFYCGQACCVEVVTFEWLSIRLEIWWTGARSTMNIRYRPVSSKFVLVPFLQVLGKRVLDIVVAAGFERVDRGFKRPLQGQFWLELDSKEQRIVVQFHSFGSGRPVYDALLRAGVFFHAEDPAYDIIVRPVDNILR